MSIELPIVSFISAVIVLVPLPWHWRTRNICSTSIIIWLATSNIVRAINTIAWLDNTIVKYKIWCDIVARFAISANVGVPAATVCICRRLAQASTPYHAAPKPREKRQRLRFEIGMCIVLPVIINVLHIIVEPCRFAITENFGCGPCHYSSIPALFIITIPTIVLSWTASIYSGVALRWMIHRRVQFQQIQTTQLIPASGSYLRLVALAITQMTFASVMSLFLLTATIQAGINLWTSWEDVHKTWRKVYVIPRNMFPEIYWTLTIVAWYFVPIVSVMTFGYFAFDSRLVAEYRSMFTWIKAHIMCIRAEKVMIPSMSGNNDAMSGQTGSDANTIAIDIGG